MSEATLFTIGYEAAGFAGVLAALQGAGVRTVIDVRDLPLSRRAGFSKGTLSASLAEAGIAYVHLKALGTPKDGRTAARQHDYRRFWDIVEQRLQSPEAQSALHSAADLALHQPCALLCFEADPKLCHRRRVAEMLVERFGFRVVDLRPAP